MGFVKLFGNLALLSAFAAAVSRTTPSQHVVEISNDSGRHVVIDWQDPSTGEVVEFIHLNSGQTIDVDSFANHTFVLRFENDTCNEKVCRRNSITVNNHDEQIVKVKHNLVVEHRDRNTKANFEASNIVQACKDNAKMYLYAGYDKSQVLKEMLSCVEEATADSFEKMHEEEKFQESLRLSISTKKENYTCADPRMETTNATEFRQWTLDNVTRRVHLLHERKASKIHLLEDFISEEECASIAEVARVKLHRGTVADGKGGHKLSEHRKAMQAGVAVPEGDNLISKVFDRIYAYANNATGFGLHKAGSEDIMSILYQGSNYESGEAPDRYMPHCDGDCNGLPLKIGGRVATMVMYCTASDDLEGGGTHFGNANVFVKPQVGAAAFFSYLDPETHVHETGWTSHSGCPVTKGIKQIAVHWMRMGVDEEHPWDSFNTLNIHKSECDDDD